MCYIDKKQLLSSLTKEEIIKVVTTLGSGEPKTDSEGNLIFQTICHNAPNPSNSYKLYYYFPDEEHSYGVFHCYSGCQDSFDLIELVIRAYRNQGKNYTWYKALNFISVITGKSGEINGPVETVQMTTTDDFEWINKLKKSKKNKRNVPNLTPINTNVLDIFSYYPHEEWLKDNCTAEALSRFCIGYYGLQDSIIIPHFDMNENLIGVRQRLLDANDIEIINGKYVPVQIDGKFLAHSLGSNLYGINVAIQAIKKFKKVIVYESEKSVIQNYSYFGDNSYAVATCGSSFTMTQFKILMSLGVEEIQLAFDKEYDDPHSYEAEAYYNKLLKLMKPYTPYCKIALVMDVNGLLERKMSPSDKGKDTLLQLLEKKIII